LKSKKWPDEGGLESGKKGAGMGKRMKVMIPATLFLLAMGGEEIWAEEKGAAQQRILIERGEKVMGTRLKLVRKVIERYKDCRVLSEGNELKSLVINGKTYNDFTIVIRDAKKTIIVVTADGVISFDY